LGRNGLEAIAKNDWQGGVWGLFSFKTGCLKKPVTSQIRYAQGLCTSISRRALLNVKHGRKAIFARELGKNVFAGGKIRRIGSGFAKGGL
jgi:hypothetical protein